MKVVQLAQPFVVPTFCHHLKPPRAVSKHNHDFTISLTLKRKAAEISPDLKGTCLFLVGINSSIKSNSAQLLADALRYYYFDSDSVVEQALGGKDAVRSFMKTDLKGFRDSETEVLKQLSSMGRLVVCAGNGAVQCAANLALMRHGISIWIDVPLDMVAKQIVEEKFQLPAAEAINGSYSEVLTQLTAIYEDSRNGYATADTTIALQNTASRLGYDTLDAVTTEDMVLETLKEVERLMRSKKLMEEAARPF
ncbi:probable inactive shikimate kinase like 1, chloroplastic [Solanum lycopersicum]|uniref:Inactive shikimate kinase like 1, chloroplastic n=1 Tax=Solanum lycopersicum TaxID=4081 RepID=A0A3Q7G0J4_SOLLC|nr:probable inactive shikimate kinase like 1, chloroplastic [Solanum lycopersicum]